MPSTVQSRGADALAAARSRRVNTITVKSKTQLASSLLNFRQSSLPTSKRVMNDSQETRLPSSPENSEVEDNESPQDASQLSSITGTPREQWDHPSSMFNGTYAPPSQIHLQQRRHSDYEPLSRLRDVASSQSHLQQRRHVAEQTQQYSQEQYSQEEATPQSHLQQRRHVAAQQENRQQQSLLHDTEQRHPLANITNAATTQSTHDSPQQCIIPEWDG
jgi:hypothetical protein